MLVTVESFGSIWSRRVRHDAADSRRTRAAYYNTTGLTVDGKLRYCSELFGQLRFNEAGGFNANVLEQNIGRVFHCIGDLEAEYPKVVFERLSNGPAAPYYYLFALSSERTGGRLPIGWYGWKSDGVLLLSLSEHREQQESILLMPAGSRVRGSLGWHVAEPLSNKPWQAFLRLVEC